MFNGFLAINYAYKRKKLATQCFPCVTRCELALLSRCSFCLKGETLDGKSPAVIDYTPYLKFTQR